MKNKNVIFIPVILALALFCACLTGAFVKDSATSSPLPVMQLNQTTRLARGSVFDYDGAPAPVADVSILRNEETANVQENPQAPAEYYVKNYTWSYKGMQWAEKLSIPASLYDYYKRQPHDRQSDYSQYAVSDYDRQSIKTIADDIVSAGSKYGYSEFDNAMNVISFVQSLPYTSDLVTTGYDEYPRYPIETLVDNGGDCEDTAILTAALLSEMGFDVVLVHLPGHMAVGVKCPDDYPGFYYEYGGARYYYLETTTENYRIGQIQDKYKNATAELLPMVQTPKVDLAFTANLSSYDVFYAYYRVHYDVTNLGPGTARNISVYASTLTSGQGGDEAWIPADNISLGDYAEGATGWAEATVKVPRNENARIECTIDGDNFNPEIVKSGAIHT